jgi:hypothetical protein
MEFAHYEPYGVLPDGWADQLRRARESRPVGPQRRVRLILAGQSAR